MGDVAVWSENLRAAAGGWREQQGTLRDARNGLAGAEASTAVVGARVAPALDAFLDAWVTHLADRAATAERHADDLDAAAADYDATDEASRQRLAQLLPWDQRGSAP